MDTLYKCNMFTKHCLLYFNQYHKFCVYIEDRERETERKRERDGGEREKWGERERERERERQTEGDWIAGERNQE